MARGIKDKVAIIGMGCSKFGERWDCSPDDLMLEAYTEAMEDAGISRDDIEMAWLGVFFDEQNVGKSAIPLSQALRLPNIPVTRVENLCATGTEALRGAVYGVASGACDMALALGVEKLKDTGYGGLPERTKGTFEDLWQPSSTAPGSFAQLASAYASKHGVEMDDLKRAMAHVSWKSHQNGALNPKAHLRGEVDMDKIINAPMVSFPLGLFDCCGVSDGSAAAIVTTPEKAREMGIENPVVVKAMQLSASNGVEMGHKSWDGSYTMTTRMAAQRAYEEAGVK
ncbi:MAG: acetyl-CoA acetyltransferase, partial [Alphaproteobacteria bacterium]|nr:acetyl-CoA acetyltransferase [Alphaproteobacteria bacterium]